MNENENNQIISKRTLSVSLIGKPNSGKSSIINAIMNRKISAVSSKPNTTNRLVRGIYVDGNDQIVFIDTPGISYTMGSTGKNQMAKSTINTNNLNIFVFPANRFFDKHLLAFSKAIPGDKKVALITKIDSMSKIKLLPMTAKLQESGFDHILYISVKHKDGIEELKSFLKTKMVAGDWEFPANDFTDMTLEDLMIESTREVIFNKLYGELPYEIKIINGEIKTNVNGEYIIYQYLDFKTNAHHIMLGKIKDISMESAKNMALFLKKPRVHLYLYLLDSKKKRKR